MAHWKEPKHVATTDVINLLNKQLCCTAICFILLHNIIINNGTESTKLASAFVRYAVTFERTHAGRCFSKQRVAGKCFNTSDWQLSLASVGRNFRIAYSSMIQCPFYPVRSHSGVGVAICRVPNNGSCYESYVLLNAELLCPAVVATFS
jgi:hypothetical protein